MHKTNFAQIFCIIAIFLAFLPYHVFASGLGSFDWRDNDALNWMTSVKDQGSCGACWAFNTVGTVEAMYNIRNNNSNLDLDLSEQYLVAKGDNCLPFYSTSVPNTCCGGNHRLALPYIRDFGVVDNVCMPYVDGTPVLGCDCIPGLGCNILTCAHNANWECSDSVCSDRCSNWQSKLTFISKTSSVSSSQQTIKEYLTYMGPLAASMRWDKGGEYWDNGVYRCNPDSDPNHAIILVGYNDIGGYWIAKSSWGTGFGDGGYFKIGYGECSIEGEVSYADLAFGCGSMIHQDTTLTQDLWNCPGNGLIIGKDNITLDCAGHTIDGTGYFRGIEIHNLHNVTIENCIIRDFAFGIQSNYGSYSNTFIGNHLQNNTYGLYVFDKGEYVAHDNEFTNNGLNAYEDTNPNPSSVNQWDFASAGNEWDDYSGSGWYYVDGPGTGIDHYPNGTGGLKDPGELCNSDSECSSSYCEGSPSHSKRCCSSSPPNDGWNGGGNTSGCGSDPSSESRDYYCNSSGSAQYETTATKNCDSQDNCATHCEGNNVVGALDYYVVQNTNTCTSTGGGVVENCTTKTSSDTDGGNVPLTAGSVTDYEYCSSGQCVGSNYSDNCESSIKLREYFPSSSSYNSQNYYCTDFEVAATDQWGDDPTHTESCTTGTGAGCSMQKFYTSSGTTGTDFCEGTCGNGSDSCMFVEYYPKDSSDDCPNLDICEVKHYSADTNPNTCSTCKGANYWSIGGETAQTTCCGDDSSEFKKTRVCDTGACTSDSSDDACCNSDAKCVYNSTCYANGYSGDVDSDSKNETCSNGTWQAPLLPPGQLCSANAECTSGYCEGSKSNSKRCCTSQPTADNWYGGGNTSGCGTDPTSSYKDYYCNSSGSAQFETTGTKNCDSQDNCATHCEGTQVVGALDYYVTLDTNACANTGGGVVEDCATKTTAETDGGNIPLVFGTLTDYNACTSGACIGPNFNDACQNTTNLLEYFASSASHSSQNWLCADLEIAATDSYGDDPTHTESCTAGTGAGCASGKFTTTAGAGGTDQCTGTCGTGANSCIFKEYYPADSTDACSGNDTCTSKNYDADTNPNTCSTCKGANYWSIGGETAASSCCGDDLNEFKKTRVCNANACTSDPSDDACCNATSKCVYNSTCYANGYEGNVDGDSKIEKCNSGTWEDAGAAPIGCGDTITEDTTLTADLLDCQGTGLYIGADNITLDCDGHLITAIEPIENYGVSLANRQGVSIKNCKIQNFSFGISLYSSNYNTAITGNILENNLYGIQLENSQYNILWDNEFSGNTNYNAREMSSSNNNSWDHDGMGNYWSDLVSNEGFPGTYVIAGPGDGVDHYPQGWLKNAGDLCNSGPECGSGFCEGSVSNPGRCCTSVPSADNWYGGSNTSGCGTDPDSDYKDYYCDATGAGQPEITDTKNCDSQDDCAAHCEGNNVVGLLDYYVIENTNTCDHTGGGIVEDCMTKISADTDNGNIPLTFGTLIDYYTCSNGACAGSDYDDICESGTNLLEYFSSDENYLTQNWLCTDLEVEATDQYGDDPAYTEECVAGTGASCAGGQFATTAGAGGTDHCEGTCGTGENSCNFVEYYSVDSADTCLGLDTCVSKNYDPDTNPNTCNTCKGENYWAIGGETASDNCCGDDASEYKTTRICMPNACDSNSDDAACCTETSKCVYGATCYANGDYIDINNDTVDEMCDAGTWVKLKAPELISPEDGAKYAYRNETFYLKWEDTGATLYHLKIILPGGPFVFEIISPEYQVPANLWNILPDYNYVWSVSSVLGAYESDYSTPRTLIRDTVPKLLSPPSGSVLGLGAQIFDWNDVANSDIYVAKVKLPTNVEITFQVKDSNYNIPANLWNNLQDGNYTWQVKSRKGTKESSYSGAWTFEKNNSPNVPPVAIATADTFVQDVSQPIHFYDNGSYDPDGGSIVKYEWDWDNDGTYDEEGIEAYHSWSTEGIYEVQFRVTDNEGQTDTLDETLLISVIMDEWELVYFDDFNDGTYDGWSVYEGSPIFSVEDGRLLLTSASESGFTITPPVLVEDGKVEFDAWIAPDSVANETGTYFRLTSSPKSGYAYVNFGAGWTPPSTALFSFGSDTNFYGFFPEDGEKDKLYHFIIEYSGSNIKCYRNQELIFDIADGKLFGQGLVGLHGYKSKVYYDNFAVFVPN